ILSPPISTLFPYTTLFRSRLSDGQSFNLQEEYRVSVKSSHVLGHPPEQFRIIDTRNADLTLDSNYADPNRLAHTFWILQTCLLRSEEHTSELQSRGHLVCR